MGEPACPRENWVRLRAQATPHERAVECGDDVWTWHDVLVEVTRRVAVLRRFVPCGRTDNPSRVAIVAANTPSCVFWILAVMSAGHTAVPVNTRLSTPELLAVLAGCRPAAVVCDESTSKLLAPADEAGSWRPALISVDAFADVPNAPDPCDPDELAGFDPERTSTVVYTSGSTGVPKGVMHSFAAHWHSACAAGSRLLGVSPADALACSPLDNRDIDAHGVTWGCVTPLCHMSGLSIVMRGLVLGTCMRIYPRFDAKTVVDDMLSGRLECLSVVTYQVERILDELDERGGPALPASLRFVLQGGGPMPAFLLGRCAERGLPVASSYGMTESASQVVLANPEETLAWPGSCGTPNPDVSVRVDAQAGEVGRIWIRTPTLAQGYLGQRERFEHRLDADGWFDTEDLGRLDAEGHLYVDVRQDELIISGGENVYPAETEAVVLMHPDVSECVVVGVDDDVWGSVPCAVCVPTKTRTPDDASLTDIDGLRAFCRERLAAYKCPRHLVWVERLETTLSGKPLRSAALPVARAALAAREA